MPPGAKSYMKKWHNTNVNPDPPGLGSAPHIPAPILFILSHIIHFTDKVPERLFGTYGLQLLKLIHYFVLCR